VNTLHLDTTIEEFTLFFYKTQCNFLADYENLWGSYENVWRGKQSTSMMQTSSAAKAMAIIFGSLKLDFRIPVLQNTANMTENNVRTAFDKYYIIENNYKIGTIVRMIQYIFCRPSTILC